jgi:hypothetical protein
MCKRLTLLLVFTLMICSISLLFSPVIRGVLPNSVGLWKLMNDIVLVSQHWFNIKQLWRLISTNNIATGMVRGSQVRFQSTKNTFSIHPNLS